MHALKILLVLLLILAFVVTVQAATYTWCPYGDAENDGDTDAADMTRLRNVILGVNAWNPYCDAQVDGDVDDGGEHVILR